MPPEKEILISIVIPVKNGAPWLHECLQGIIGQTLFNKTEIIVVDSGSTDSTSSILKQYPVHVVSINPAEFNHGLTRNYALQFCKGNYVVMTVQDAKTVDKNWLQYLLDGFTSNDVVAVCGKQVVPHEKTTNPVDWYRPVSKGSITTYQFKDKAAFESLSPAQKMQIGSWDNVNAMYRKEALMATTFRRISYGEDAAWALDTISKGEKIAYTTMAMLYHYHKQDEAYAFKRTLTVMYLRYKLFGFTYDAPKRSLKSFLSMMKTILKSVNYNMAKTVYWLRYNNEILKGEKKAHKVFTAALKQGGHVLDEVHEKICGKPPVPLQATGVI